MTGHHKCCSQHVPSPGSELITLTNVGITRGDREVLSNVNLTVSRGDFIAITGPNGGGKTTLLRLILLLLKPTTGSITYANPAPKIGYLPQKNSIDSRFPITVREVISSGLLGAKHTNKAEIERQVKLTAQQVGLESRLDSAIGALSGGQLQRALLGRAIISSPEVLVLDEPLSYLDKMFEKSLYDLIRELSKTTTIILVSHEMPVIASMANRHFIVDGGLKECTAAHHYAHFDTCC